MTGMPPNGTAGRAFTLAGKSFGEAGRNDTSHCRSQLLHNTDCCIE